MREISGDHSGGETPVPIPNTAVKPTSADGTALATGWESRSLPGISLLFSAPKGAFLYPRSERAPTQREQVISGYIRANASKSPPLQPTTPEDHRIDLAVADQEPGLLQHRPHPGPERLTHG